MGARLVGAAILAGQLIVTASVRLELGRNSAAQRAQAATSGQDASAEGLSWRFVRIRYHAWPALERTYLRNYWSAPWAIDAPAAEQNLSRRVQARLRLPSQIRSFSRLTIASCGCIRGSTSSSRAQCS
jgi:hypothetical protein